MWFKKGNQGMKWLYANVELNLEPNTNFAIDIEAQLVDWNYGDIAIDDIQFKKGSCPSKFFQIFLIILKLKLKKSFSNFELF